MRDLTGTHVYALTDESLQNRLLSFTDTGPGSTITTLAIAPANTSFRGVRFVREPYDVTFAGAGCPTAAGIPSIAIAGGLPISGNANFGIAIGSTPPLSLYLTVVSIAATLGPGLPYSAVGGPPCAMLYAPTVDILFAGFTTGAGTAITPLPLGTPDQALWGLDLAVQHLVVDPATYGSFALPLAPSRGMHVVIGS